LLILDFTNKPDSSIELYSDKFGPVELEGACEADYGP